MCDDGDAAVRELKALIKNMHDRIVAGERYAGCDMLADDSINHFHFEGQTQTLTKAQHMQALSEPDGPADPHAKDADVAFHNITVDAPRAVVDLQFTSFSGHRVRARYHMLQKAGRWTIARYEARFAADGASEENDLSSFEKRPYTDGRGIRTS